MTCFAIQGIDSPLYENGVELPLSDDEKFALSAKFSDPRLTTTASY